MLTSSETGLDISRQNVDRQRKSGLEVKLISPEEAAELVIELKAIGRLIADLILREGTSLSNTQSIALDRFHRQVQQRE